MLTLPQSYDYSAFDQDSISERLRRATLSVLPDWGDFDEPHLDNVILAQFCFLFDVLGKYIPDRTRQTRIASATERKSMARACRLHNGYTMSGRTAARVDVTFSIPAIHTEDIPIPAKTPLFTSGANRITGELLSDVVILAGTLSITGTWEHSTTREENFVSTTLPYQRIYLSYSPFIDGSLEVEDDLGAPGFTLKEYLSGSGSADQHMKVAVDNKEYGQIRFGDGQHGAVPVGTIKTVYRTGGGEEGNVQAGRLTVIGSQIYDDLGDPIQVSVTNPLDATPGMDRETIEHARQEAPASLWALTRTVSRVDYETNAKRVAQIARALFLTHNQVGSIGVSTGQLHLISYGTKTNSGKYRPASPTQADKDDAVEMVTTTYPCPPTILVQDIDPNFETVDFEIRAAFKDGQDVDDGAQGIFDALDDFFAVADENGAQTSNVDFGYYLNESLKWSKLFTEVSNLDEIDYLDEDSFKPRNHVILTTSQFPKIGTVKVTDINTGQIWNF